MWSRRACVTEYLNINSPLKSEQTLCDVVQAWLEQHGPVHVIDGANVALYGCVT